MQRGKRRWQADRLDQGLPADRRLQRHDEHVQQEREAVEPQGVRRVSAIRPLGALDVRDTLRLVEQVVRVMVVHNLVLELGRRRGRLLGHLLGQVRVVRYIRPMVGSVLLVSALARRRVPLYGNSVC
jgi:hypothetical protein